MSDIKDGANSADGESSIRDSVSELTEDETIEVASPPPDPTVEEHAKAHGTHPATFAAAQIYFGWGLGRRLSRRDYDEAIGRIENLEFR